MCNDKIEIRSTSEYFWGYIEANFEHINIEHVRLNIEKKKRLLLYIQKINISLIVI